MSVAEENQPVAQIKARMVVEMVRNDVTLNVLNQLPVGVAIPLREALFQCKQDPSALSALLPSVSDGITLRAYELIGRDDLAALAAAAPARVQTPVQAT